MVFFGVEDEIVLIAPLYNVMNHTPPLANIRFSLNESQKEMCVHFHYVLSETADYIGPQK